MWVEFHCPRSFYWLWIGEWPDRDWNGKKYLDPSSIEFQRKKTKLADGFFAVLWVIRGDLDYFAKYLGLPAHNARMVYRR